MAEIQAHVVALAQPVDLPHAMAARQLPSVTVFNRLEGRPRTRSFDGALRAEVRDPLWMLTRQWQVGELEADDAGSPILAQLHLEHTLLDGLGAREHPVVPFADPLPLEARVERRPVVFQLGTAELSLDLRLLLGRRWRKMLADPGAGLSADYRAAFTSSYAFTAPNPTAAGDVDRAGHLPVWQAYATVAARAMDGGALYEHLTANPPGRPYDGVAGIAGIDQPILDGLATRFVAWFQHLVLPAPADDQDSWDPQRLDYRFRATAPTADGGSRRYVAEGFHGGRLDWWSLDLEATDPPPVPPAPDPVQTKTSTMLPAPVTFDGMPATRWWAFEDGRTNLGDVDAATTDVATLLFLEFALVYANDWFMVPVGLPVGSVAQVRGLAVTNVFGERFWITPAGSGVDDTWQRWSMFSTSLVGEGAADTSLLVLPVVAKVQDGPVHEEVALVRDEMANMVWGVERVIPSGAGGGMPGPLSGLETAAYFARLAAAAPPPPGPVVPEPRVAAVRYQTMGSVPEQWIPFLPVHVDGDNRQIQLQRAALPRIVPGDNAAPVPIEPRTALLREGRDLPVQAPYLLHEEEVSRAGTVVSQCFRRTRDVGGRAVVWVGVARGPGRGGGSSGLAFDQLINIPEE